MKLKSLYEDVALSAFGKELRKLLRSNEAMQILNSDSESNGSGWNDGGCYVLAKSLQELIPSSELWGIFREGGTGIDGKADHFIVKVGNTFYDGDGGSNTQQIIKRMYGDNPNLQNLVAKRASEKDVHPDTPSGRSLIDQIKSYLLKQGENNYLFGNQLHKFSNQWQ